MAVLDGTVRQHVLATMVLQRTRAVLIGVLISLVVSGGAGLAAPQVPVDDSPTGYLNLGGGTYRVTASVFAEGTDGQVGTQASSGHWIQPNDNLVALPACTESSCPWVATGTGVEGQYGPQTTCAESDGLCWVKIISDTTGECTVAPVHDRGPLFVRDNWWAPQSQREYDVPQGIPAAEYARDGVNFGYGAGLSDVGHDIQNVYRYAAGIDLAGGTWKNLGLPISAGITTLTVTMLWQAGINHTQACGGSSGSSPGSSDTSGNAATTAGLNLRSGCSLSASIITVMPSGSRIEVTGGSQNGYYPLTYRGSSGWASGDYIRFDSGQDPGQADSGSTPPPASTNGPTATVIDGALNLRTGAGTNFSVITVMPNGAQVTLTGQTSGGWKSVSYNGNAGWAFAEFLSTSGNSSDDDGASPPATTGSATTTAALNMRAGSSTGYAVLLVVPRGATVSLTSSTSNGYTRVVYSGTTGWVLSSYLGSGSGTASPPQFSSSETGPGTVIDGALNLRSGHGLGYSVLLVMPGNASLTLLGEASNGYVKVTYAGTTGWAASTYIQVGGSSNSGDGTATGIDGALNLRTNASINSAVILVMPGGAQVILNGQSQNGYTSVTYNGVSGWAYRAYLQ